MPLDPVDPDELARSRAKGSILSVYQSDDDIPIVTINPSTFENAGAWGFLLAMTLRSVAAALHPNLAPQPDGSRLSIEEFILVLREGMDDVLDNDGLGIDAISSVMETNDFTEVDVPEVVTDIPMILAPIDDTEN